MLQGFRRALRLLRGRATARGVGGKGEVEREATPTPRQETRRRRRIVATPVVLLLRTVKRGVGM